MRFKKINIQQNSEYTGNIVNYSIDDDKRFFRVFVEIDGAKGITFMKCIRYAEFMPSPLADLCENFGIVDNRGNVDFDELIGVPVVVTLVQGKDENFYISDIEPMEEDYDEE